MNAAHRRWHPRLWLLVGLLAVAGLVLGVALRGPAAIGPGEAAAEPAAGAGAPEAGP